MSKTVYLEENKLIKVKSAITDDKISYGTFVHEDNPSHETDKFEIGGEGGNNDFFHVDKNINESYDIKNVDLSDVGEVKYEWYFDQDEYNEWLNDNELVDSEETRNQYYKEEVTYGVMYYDNETFHLMATNQNLLYYELEELFGENMANQMLSNCIKKGEGSFETYELYENETFDINNHEELNNYAMKIFSHGEYYKDCRGFILSNGVVVYTPSEHNEICMISGIDSKVQFIKLGNIRVLPNSIDIGCEPTYEQKEVLREVISSYSDDELYVDILDNGEEIGAKYINPDWRYVIGEINRYYYEGIKPQGNDIYETSKKHKRLIINENQILALKENTFEKWFGNSLLKDENGKPIKMYHGSDYFFNEFSKKHIGKTGSFEGYGFNFTPYESRARSYSNKNVIEAYLRVEHPMTSKECNISLNKLIKIIAELDKEKPFSDTVVAAFESPKYGEKFDLAYYRRALPIAAKTIFQYNNENGYGDAGIYADLCLNGNADVEKTIDLFEKIGYDSVIFYDNEGRINTVVVFEPNQIKRTSNKTFNNDSNIMDEEQQCEIEENIESEVDADEVNLDSFKKRNELAPKIWKGFDLNPKVRLKLLDIADDFWDFTNITWVKRKGIHITGSICNFNWSKFSDIDLHIIVDFSEIDERKDFVQEYFNSKKNEWNDEHSKLKIYGYPVELYVEDVDAETMSCGLYDLEDNSWIKKPSFENIKQIGLNKYEIKTKSAKLMTDIDDLYDLFKKTNDDAKLRKIGENAHKLLNKIKRMRKFGLQRGGESDSFNIIYKVLRRSGYMDIIWRLSSELYDKLNSITESGGYNNRIIMESQESKSISAAKKLVMQKLKYNEQQADEFIRIKLRNDIPILRTPQGGKFILGVTRMFCDGELRNTNDINNLNSTLKLVASDAHINEYDRNLNNLSLQELVQRFAKAMSDNIEAEKEEVGQMTFNTPSDYEIVRIGSFEQAEEYGQYVSWCVTHDERMFDSYTSDGINQFYFCLKHGFENVKAQPTDGCPLDEYGLSMIAVSVNENGMLNTCTCRWNHDNGGDDSIMNTKEVSQVIGMNFFEVFKPNNKWKELISDIMQRIARGESPESVFDYVDDFSEGFAMVSLNDKYNFINQECSLISDQWFDDAYYFSEGFATVRLNSKYNFINQEGKFLSDQWFDVCGDFHDGFAWVEINGKRNFINQEGSLLSGQWFNSAYSFSEGFAVVRLNSKRNFINQEGKFLSDQWFDDAYNFSEGFGEVRLNGSFYKIDANGNLSPLDESAINDKSLIREYLEKDHNEALYRYFKWSKEATTYEKAEDLAYECSYSIKKYILMICDRFSDFESLLNEYGDFDYEDDEKIEEFCKLLEKNNLCDHFVSTISNFVDCYDLPTWYFTDFVGLVKNQWCIHFTNDSDNVAKYGLTGGTYDVSRLAYTGAGQEKHSYGYNFAFLIDDKNVDYNEYGDEAVIFRTSGVEIYHYGDNQNQVVFWGPNVKSFIPIHQDNGDWVVYGQNGQVLVRCGRPSEIALWATENLPQYRKQIMTGKNGYIPMESYWDKEQNKVAKKPYPLYKNESLKRYLNFLYKNIINEEVVADGNANRNPFKKRWKHEREVLINYLTNYGEIMTSKENGKEYKVFYDQTLSSRLGINYCICIQWNSMTMEPGNIIYVRAYDKFTRRRFKPEFDTRGIDNDSRTDF